MKPGQGHRLPEGPAAARHSGIRRLDVRAGALGFYRNRAQQVTMREGTGKWVQGRMARQRARHPCWCAFAEKRGLHSRPQGGYDWALAVSNKATTWTPNELTPISNLPVWIASLTARS